MSGTRNICFPSQSEPTGFGAQAALSEHRVTGRRREPGEALRGFQAWEARTRTGEVRSPRTTRKGSVSCERLPGKLNSFLVRCEEKE